MSLLSELNTIPKTPHIIRTLFLSCKLCYLSNFLKIELMIPIIIAIQKAAGKKLAIVKPVYIETI